jgi:hypothetical protein
MRTLSVENATSAGLWMPLRTTTAQIASAAATMQETMKTFMVR